MVRLLTLLCWCGSASVGAQEPTSMLQAKQHQHVESSVNKVDLKDAFEQGATPDGVALGLLAGVAKGDNITAMTVELETHVVQTIIEASTSDQKLLNTSHTTQVACGTTRTSVDETISSDWASFIGAKDEHKLCRANQYEKNNSQTVACNAFDAWLVVVNGGTRCYESVDRATASPVLTNFVTNLNDLVAKAQSHKQWCDGNATANGDIALQCTLDQQNMVSDYCTWHQLQEVQWKIYFTCRSAIDIEFANQVKEVKQREASRKAQYQWIKEIVCILHAAFENLQLKNQGSEHQHPDPVQDLTSVVDECRSQDINTDSLDITYPDQQSLEVNVNADVAVPSEDEWISLHWDDLEYPHDPVISQCNHLTATTAGEVLLHYSDSGSGFSCEEAGRYEEAENVCSSRGKSLCTSEQLCPGASDGVGHTNADDTVLASFVGGILSTDQWVAIKPFRSGSMNFEWMQIGTRWPSDLCLALSASDLGFSDYPGWGCMTYTEHIACCGQGPGLLQFTGNKSTEDVTEAP